MYVNVRPHHERRRKLLTYAQLKALPPGEEQVYCTNLIDDYYPQRPDVLENKSLYEIASWYEYHPYSTKKRPSDKAKRDGNVFDLKTGLGWFQKRAHAPKVIKTPWFSTKTKEAAENYYHGMLLLFKPWRNEHVLMQPFE